MIRNPKPLTENAIREIADQVNIPLLGIINADPILEMLPYEKQRRKENHGMIPFVRTKPERRIDFKTVMPEVKSVIVIGIPYPLFLKKIDDDMTYGYFSSVTCGMDYHQVVMAKMDELCKRIQSELSANIQYKKFVDNSRLMDKASAWKAGLGFFGKNNLLIHPQFGSAWNIGQILVNKEITHEEHPPIESQCGQCQRCIKACPGHALGERGYQLFYERCISYLTQKKKLTKSEEERIRYFLYGCDICQWVCPFNKRERKNLKLDSRVRLDEILHMSEEEIKSRFANRALSWLPASVLQRNARILKNRSKTSFNDIITNNINAKEKILMVRVRFAPSPTGNVHVGSLRTALYNYLFAKQNDGTFVLRLEDTDRTRYQEGSVENLLNALYTTGVVPDEGLQLVDGVPVENGEYGPYIQSERLGIYKKYIQQLIDEGKAYYCFCSKERLTQLREKQKAAGETPRYDGHCRNLSPEEVQKRIDNGDPYVIRLKLPENTDITFNDVVRGKITINTKEMDDQVLIKEDGFPTYHFAVVIDDHLMKITHVIRGEEWLPSTPKHVYLYQCFGWQPPTFVHLSNILNEDHKKLSKRQGDVAVGDFLDKGYLPEALVNFLALLGWSPEDDQEIFSLKELEEAFDIHRISNSGAVFDREKLNWMNGQYIKNASSETIAQGIQPFLEKAGMIQTESEKTAWLGKVAELLRDRIDYFAQAPEQLKQILDDDYQIDASDEAQDILHAETVPILCHALDEKITSSEQWNAEYIQKDIIKAIQKEHKQEKIKGKALYMPIRLILTGSMHGPDLALIMDVLGKDVCLNRLHHYMGQLKEEK